MSLQIYLYVVGIMITFVAGVTGGTSRSGSFWIALAWPIVVPIVFVVAIYKMATE